MCMGMFLCISDKACIRLLDWHSFVLLYISIYILYICIILCVMFLCIYGKGYIRLLVFDINFHI